MPSQGSLYWPNIVEHTRMCFLRCLCAYWSFKLPFHSRRPLTQLWRVSVACRYEILNTQVDVSLDLQRICQVKQRFLKLHGIFEIEAFLSGWFNGAPLAAIKRGNVEEFVAYGFYTRSLSSLPAEVGSHPVARRRTGSISVLSSNGRSCSKGTHALSVFVQKHALHLHLAKPAACVPGVHTAPGPGTTATGCATVPSQNTAHWHVCLDRRSSRSGLLYPRYSGSGA